MSINMPSNLFALVEDFDLRIVPAIADLQGELTAFFADQVQQFFADSEKILFSANYTPRVDPLAELYLLAPDLLARISEGHQGEVSERPSDPSSFPRGPVGEEEGLAPLARDADSEPGRLVSQKSSWAWSVVRVRGACRSARAWAFGPYLEPIWVRRPNCRSHPAHATC